MSESALAAAIDWAALAAPFEPSEMEWRVGQKTKDGRKATLLAYLTARAVMDRLDRVVGPAHWRDAYVPVVEGTKTVGYLCTLELEVRPGVWVPRADVSDTSDIEALKGAVSGALKRAAVKWGIGRYLYGLDSSWHEIREGYAPRGTDAVYCPMEGGKPGHILPPTLPDWARPAKAAPPPAPRPPTPTREEVVARVVDQLVAQGWCRETVLGDIREHARSHGVSGDPWAAATERLLRLPQWAGPRAGGAQ